MKRATKIDAPALAPSARVDAATRALASAIGELVEAQIAQGVAASEWIDQTQSPLGRNRHCRLAREGAFPSRKVGRSVLVKREELDRYLETKLRQIVDVSADEDREVERVVARLRRSA